MPKRFYEFDETDGTTIHPWKNRRTRWRILGGVIAFISVVLFLLLTGYPKAKEWRRQRIKQSAQAYLDLKDYRRGYMLLDQLLKETPGDKSIMRLYAASLEATDPQAALEWWTKLVAQEGAGSEDFVGAARVALRLKQWDVLQANLTLLEKTQPDNVDYHRFAAAQALMQHDKPTLRKHLEALVRLEPKNELTRFSLATAMLDAEVPVDREHGREVLARYARGSALRIRATLALLEDAPRRWPEEKGSSAQMERLSRFLGLDQGALAGYKSVRLSRSGEWTDLVEYMKNQPKPSPEDAVALAQWLMKNDRVPEALLWLDTLEVETRQAPAVLKAMSVCAVKTGSWVKLEQLLQEGAWGPIPVQVISLAFQAHAARGARNESKMSSNWSQALQLADQSLPALQMLQQLAQAWQWPIQRGQVLWVIIRKNPRETWVWPVLAEQAMQARDTAEIWRVYGSWAQVAPDNAQVQIERVLLGLLVRPSTPGLVTQADALWRQHPDKPVCHVLKALALWREGRSREGLEIFEAQLLLYHREPRFALIYALLLAQEGRLEKSRQILAGLSSAKFLPEEQQLIASLQKSGP